MAAMNMSLPSRVGTVMQNCNIEGKIGDSGPQFVVPQLAVRTRTDDVPSASVLR